MKILITGGEGATAKYLAQYIAENYPFDDVYAPSRDEMDLLFPRTTEIIIHDCQPDLIFHLAAETHLADSFKNPALFMGNNFNGTMNLLEAVRTQSPKSRVLMASTCEVYGKPEYSPMDEEHPFAPLSPYAVSKAAVDHMAIMYAKVYGLHIVVSRMFNLINPRAEHLFSSQFARQVAEIEAGTTDTLFYGNLDSARTLLDVRDVVRGYWILIEKGKSGEAYNIGSPTEVRLRDFLDILTGHAQKTIPRCKSDALVRPTDITTQISDSRKFLEATGWKPEYSLFQSIEFLIDYWRSRVAKR